MPSTPQERLRDAMAEIAEELQVNDRLRRRIKELAGGQAPVDLERWESLSIEVLGAVHAGDRCARRAEEINGRLRGDDRERVRMQRELVEEEVEQLREAANSNDDPRNKADGLLSLADELEQLQIVEELVADKLSRSADLSL